MSADERRQEILSRLPEGECRMAEIGVWNGRLSTALLQWHPKLTLLMVDRWAEVGEDHAYAQSGARLALRKQPDMDRAREACERLVRFYGNRAVPMQGESVQMAAGVEDGSLDLVFIDADHSYAGVMDDLVAWYPKLKPGGWIGGHDWGNKRADTNWDVQGAVDTFIRDNHLAPNVQTGADKTWFLQLPGMVRSDIAAVAEDSLLVYACSFGASFAMMAKWLERSIERNCPNATFRHESIRHPRRQGGYADHTFDNTAKLHKWNDVVQSADCRLVLMDVDMVVLGDLGRAFETTDFDLAYTVRPGPNLINAGVLYINPTDAAKAFFADFVATDDRLMADQEEAAAGVKRYGGINQAAFSIALEANQRAALHALPCVIWNSTRQTWGETIQRLADPEAEQTVVLHVNSRLRHEVFQGRVPTENNAHLAPLVKIVLDYKK